MSEQSKKANTMDLASAMEAILAWERRPSAIFRRRIRRKWWRFKRLVKEALGLG